MFYVYILFSNSGNRFYIGQTNNVEARIARHNAKTEAATSPYAPWEKVLVIEKPSRGEAMILEKKLKNLNLKTSESSSLNTPRSRHLEARPVRKAKPQIGAFFVE